MCQQRRRVLCLAKLQAPVTFEIRELPLDFSINFDRPRPALPAKRCGSILAFIFLKKNHRNLPIFVDFTAFSVRHGCLVTPSTVIAFYQNKSIASNRFQDPVVLNLV